MSTSAPESPAGPRPTRTRSTRTRSTRTSFVFLAALLVPALGGCDSTGPGDDDAYTLVAVGGELPGRIPCCGGAVEASAGSLELADDDTMVQRLELRCADGAACTIPEGWDVMTGQLDRQAGVVTWDDNRTAQVALTDAVITVTHPYPPSTGFGSVPFRFER